MKPRGTGPTVDLPVPGVAYRHPWYKKGHIYLSLTSDEAACGRLLIVDELWWVDSGWEGRLGELYLVEDTRESGRCGDCGKGWQLHMEEQRRKNKADIFTRQERPKAIAARDVQLGTHKAWQAEFERLWGEPVELIL